MKTRNVVVLFTPEAHISYCTYCLLLYYNVFPNCRQCRVLQYHSLSRILSVIFTLLTYILLHDEPERYFVGSRANIVGSEVDSLDELVM